MITLAFKETTPIPAPVRQHYEININELFDRLVHGPVMFDAPTEISRPCLRQMIYERAQGKGLWVSVRFVGTQVWVGVRNGERRWSSRYAERNASIIQARESGETEEAIGRRFSLSRQRVDQIVGKFTRFPHYSRKAETLEFLKPYFQHVGKRFCVVCGREAGRARKLCGQCNEFQTVIMQIKGYLTAYLNGHEQGRRQAIYLIRKYKIRPEDLAPVNGMAREGGCA